MTDDLHSGHPSTAETAVSPAGSAEADPDVLVFGDVGSLVASFGPDEAAPTSGLPAAGPVQAPAPASLSDPAPAVDGPAGTAPPTSSTEPGTTSAPEEAVTDEERTRYGRLLDSAAERGLLDPADYEIRLRDLSEATTKAQMIEIVTELPAFTAAAATPARSRRSVPSATRTGMSAGRPGPGTTSQEGRRVGLWLLMGIIIVAAVAALVILALSAQRLSHSRSSSPPAAPTRSVSALRL